MSPAARPRQGGTATASPDGLIGLRADAPGTLPTGDSTAIGGITLRSGHPIRHAETPDARPVGWLSAARATVDDWTTVAEQFPSTGLWPVLVDGLDPDSGLDRPWLDGEFDTPESADGVDVADLMQSGWANLDDDSLGPWPGLATGSPGPALFRVPLDFADTEAAASGLLLVPVTRPADVVGALGWYGATNYWSPGEVSAVLRSWEDRFGAIPIFLNFDSVYLSVSRPPTGSAEIDRTTAEHAAFVPDMIWQEWDDYDEYRDSAVRAHSWTLWWD